MSFGPAHYVPVLKIKRGEKKALQAVGRAGLANITPLLEIVERSTPISPSTVESHITKVFNNLTESTSHYRRFFLDAREIASDGPAAAASVFDLAAASGLAFIPVTGISRSADVAAALRHANQGIAIRLTREEFENGSLARGLRAFLTTHRLTHRKVDLIVDLGAVDDLIQYGVTSLATAFLDEVPDKTRWRTLTLSSCAFPSSMGGVARNSHARVARTEWVMWRDVLHANRLNIERLPTFSDCVIQHPRGVEGFDPRTMQGSASIRYTDHDTWLLIKGEGTKTSPPTEQFPGLATSLVYGGHRGAFGGSSHCEGCDGMKAAADGARGFGSLEVWRRLGTIHHITTVVQDLASLPSP